MRYRKYFVGLDVSIGDSMRVKITKIDKKTNRVSASVKALTEDPFQNIEKKYKVGEIYEGVVTKLMDYGAFCKIEEANKNNTS